MACHPTTQTPAITFKYNVTPDPPRIGAVTIDVQLRDAKGQPVSGARVELEGNMSHPGMSPVSATAKEIESGKYRGTLQLTMAGDWIVVANVTLSDGKHVQHQFELPLPQ
ncbi:MAG TPA: FixH family protein [Pyrinomonadaceae bacterium]|nr:FixH family protein [Pyrinomonadaceae bacterium]